MVLFNNQLVKHANVAFMHGRRFQAMPLDCVTAYTTHASRLEVRPDNVRRQSVCDWWIEIFQSTSTSMRLGLETRQGVGCMKQIKRVFIILVCQP